MLINKLLSSTVKLWLKSQVSEIKNLKITIIGNNKQILTGYIPEINICADDAIYQGLYLSKLKVKGTNIKFDLSQIINKKKFELSEPVVIDIILFSSASKLQKSLSSSLLHSGLTDIWYLFLESNLENTKHNRYKYSWHNLALFDRGIEFEGIYQHSDTDNYHIGVKTNIKLLNEHSLLLSPTKLNAISNLSIKDIQPLTFDLGKQVYIDRLEITKEYLSLQGKITIYP